MNEIVKQLQSGDLAALFYNSRAEQFSFIIPYIARGLSLNERCLYIADNTPVGLILSNLEKAGVDVETARKKGALDILTKHETYMRHGNFESDKMAGDLELEAAATVAKGFTRLRGSGDMGWALEKASLLAKMIDYQTKLYASFPANFLAVCQYDVSRFPDYAIQKMESLHTVIIRGGMMTRRRPPLQTDGPALR